MKIKPDDYKFFIKLKDWSEIKLEYPEATIWESLDFLETISMANFSLIEYIYNFMVEYWDREITKKEFENNIVLWFSEFLAQIKASRFNWIFEKNEEKEQKEEKIQDVKTKKEFSMGDIERDLAKIIAFLSPKMSIDPKAIMKKYTWSELNFWAKWYIYIENEKTEEWRKHNIAISNKAHIEKNKEFYDAEFKKLDLYLKKKEIWKKS